MKRELATAPRISLRLHLVKRHSRFRITARVTAWLDFFEQLPATSASVRPAARQIVPKNSRRSRCWRPLTALWERGRTHPLLGRAPVYSHLSGDIANIPSCGLQNLDPLKRRLSRTIVRAPREMSMLSDFLSAARTARSRAAVFAVGYRQRWASHPSVGAAQLVFDRLPKVLKKMEAVGDLARLRRAFTRSLRKSDMGRLANGRNPWSR